LLLPVLILWNLFLFVIKDHVYPLFSPEVALSLFALAFLAGFISLLSLAKRRAYSAAAVAALLVFFIDFTSEPSMQLHKLALLGLFILLFIAILKLGHTFYLPAVGAMSVMLITTLVILMQQTQPGIAAFDTSGPVAKDAPPRLIHLLLDEHLGIEGFPKSHPFGRVMKERLKEFYKTRGFQLYGNAYGHYCNTFDAVPSLLNFTREPTPKQFVSGDEGSYVVTRNRYFELLKERGYRLHVISAGYLDFCAETPALTADCQQARFSSWGSVSALKVPTADKAVFLLRSFVTGYPRYQRLQRLYDISWRPLLLKNGGYFSRLADSMWMTPPAHTYTSNAMETIERTWNNILSLPQGHAAFIHLMLPHFRIRLDRTARPGRSSSGRKIWNMCPMSNARHSCKQSATNTISNRWTASWHCSITCWIVCSRRVCWMIPSFWSMETMDPGSPSGIRRSRPCRSRSPTCSIISHCSTL
jgi:hypothetical protein